MREARALAHSARGNARRKRASVALLERLERELEAAEQVLAQTDLRLTGQRTIPDRRVSLVDPDARPIRMGSPPPGDRVWLQGAGGRHRRGLRDRRCARPWRPPLTAACSTARSATRNGRDAGALGLRRPRLRHRHR
jgi:hypothetical protein